jgi:predicted phospho-2-dehydro-3-deoxyheptonate aldolase
MSEGGKELDGKALRLSRLFSQECKKTCLVPIDHGTTFGPIDGIKDYNRIIKQVIEGGANGVVLHKGLLKSLNQYETMKKGHYIVHLSASTNLCREPSNKVLVTSIEEAIKLGADCVSIHVSLGAECEREMLRDFGIVSRHCTEWGMPLLAMMYVINGTKKTEYIKHAVRIAEELGADIVKTECPGRIEDLSDVTEHVQIPVVVAGGEKMEDPKMLLKMVNDAVQAGVSGVAIGRNIFQYKNPGLLTNMVYKILNNQLTLEESFMVLENNRQIP